MHKTPFAGLTAPDPNDPPLSVDGGSFATRNPDLIDHFLRIGAVDHRHDEHPALADPIITASATVDVTGGTIPAGRDLYIGYTLIDQYGGETLISPVVNATTPPPLDAPVTPFDAAFDDTAGTLPVGTFVYALTLLDESGGETMLGPSSRVERPPGTVTGQVNFTGLAADLGPDMGAQWRLWRADNGGQFNIIAAGIDDTFTDDGIDPVDHAATPPTSSIGTRSTNVVIVSIPDGTTEPGLVDGQASAFALYVSDDGTFSNPCLYDIYPRASAGTDITITDPTVIQGSPPDVSRSIPGAHKITAAELADGVGGGGGGGASLTQILPPPHPAWGWSNSQAEMDAASVVWRDNGQEKVAVVARYADDQTGGDDPVWIGDPGAFDPADWQGDTSSWTWDAVGSALVGTGTLGADHILERDSAGPAYDEGGRWQGRFQVDVGWERLYAGAIDYTNVNNGFLGVIDRVSAKFQIVQVTDSSPLTYTVLAEAPIVVPAAGETVMIYIQKIGNQLLGIPINDGTGPLLASWLRVDVSATPLTSGGYLFTFGANYTASDAVKVLNSGASYANLVTELVAGDAAPGATDPLGGASWSIGNETVIYRSDGTGAGLPDAWQPLSNITVYQNGWVDHADDGAEFIQWGRHMMLRGRMTNTTWAVGSAMAEVYSGPVDGVPRSFYVGAEDGTTLGQARLDLTPPVIDGDPWLLVLGATNLSDPAEAIDLHGISWELVPW